MKRIGPTRRGAISLAVTLALVAAGCGGDADEAISPVATAATPTTTVAGSTVSPDSTSSSSTAPSTTEPVPATTAPTQPVTSAAPPTTGPAVTTTPTGVQLGPAPETAVTLDGFDLVERDVATGDIVRVIAPDFAFEATYPNHFTLTADRTRLYFAETIEDYWYACESSPGEVFVADMATGARTLLGAGTAPALSPDGTKLAYLEASQCLPDPEAPEFWVVTPLDRVVVLDLASGARTEFPTSEPPTAEDDPSALAWVGFDDERSVLAATVGGDLRRLDLAAPTDVSSGEPVADLDGREPVAIGESWIITVNVGDEGSVDVYRVERDGGMIELLARSEYPVRLGVSSDGHVIIAHDEAQPPPTDVADWVTLLPVIGLYAGVDW